jgi:hypothetical protein
VVALWRLGGGLEKAALFAGGNSQGAGAELPRNGHTVSMLLAARHSTRSAFSTNLEGRLSTLSGHCCFGGVPCQEISLLTF